MPVHLGADLYDLAEELVADHVPRAHRRDVAADLVQVRATHRAQLHLDDRVLPVDDLGVWHLLDRHLVDPFPAQSLHGRPSPRARRTASSSGKLIGVRRVVGGSSGLKISPVSRSILASRRAARTDWRGSWPVSRAAAALKPEGTGPRKRAASSVPRSPGAGRIWTSIWSPSSASGSGSRPPGKTSS